MSAAPPPPVHRPRSDPPGQGPPTSSSTSRPSPGATAHPDDRRTSHRRAVLAGILVTVLWSSSWVLIRIGLDDESLPPLTFAGLRYGLAALVLVGWVARRDATRRQVASLGRRQVGRLALLGVVFYTITQGAQFVAIDRQPAATTSLVLSVTPLVVAAVSARTLGERTSRRQLVGAGLVALGAWAYFAGSLGRRSSGWWRPASGSPPTPPVPCWAAT